MNNVLKISLCLSAALAFGAIGAIWMEWQAVMDQENASSLSQRP
jgi:predicted outer membrane lipoprotein